VVVTARLLAARSVAGPRGWERGHRGRRVRARPPRRPDDAHRRCAYRWQVFGLV